MSLSATLKRESFEEGEVRYVDSYGGPDAFLADGIVVRAVDLPDPPPALIHITLSWYQTAASAGGDTGAAGSEPAGLHATPGAAHGAGHPNMKQGDVVKIVKSRISGVRNPPEWLEQHLGKTGVVLWTTASGANVDLDGTAVWFAFEELELQG
jgi:hypothetical protein